MCLRHTYIYRKVSVNEQMSGLPRNDKTIMVREMFLNKKVTNDTKAGLYACDTLWLLLECNGLVGDLVSNNLDFIFLFMFTRTEYTSLLLAIFFAQK